MSDSPLFGTKSAIARCPKCREFIDSASQVCRFCKAVLSSDELRASAALQHKITLERSRANNRKALIYSVWSLAGTVVAAIAWVAMGRYRRPGLRFRRDNEAMILTDLMQIVMDNVLLLAAIILIPLIVVVLLRWRRASAYPSRHP